MPKGTPVFAPSGFPPEPTAYVLAALDPGFTHDEFVVPTPPVSTYLLHQTPGRFSCMVALNGLVLSESVDYTTDYDSGEITLLVTLHAGDKIEARYAVTAVETSTNVRVTDITPVAVPTVTDAVLADRQTPINISPVDTVSDHETIVTDSVGSGLGLARPVLTDADDGWTSTIPGFTTTGPTVQVGNSATEIRQAYMNFPMPQDLAGRTIIRAWLRFTPDAATAAPGVKIRFRADASGTAASPTTKADYDGRTLTTSFVDWQTAMTAGVEMDSPDLKTVVQEVASAGTTTTVLLMLLDNASATDEFAQIRAFGHSTGPKPLLYVEFI